MEGKMSVFITTWIVIIVAIAMIVLGPGFFLAYFGMLGIVFFVMMLPIFAFYGIFRLVRLLVNLVFRLVGYDTDWD